MSILTPRKPDKGPKDEGPKDKGPKDGKHSKLKRIIFVCVCIAVGLAVVGLVASVALSASGNQVGPTKKANKKAHVHKGKKAHKHKHRKGHKGRGQGRPPANALPRIDSVTNNGPVDETSSAIITINAIDPEGTTLSYEFDCDNDGTYEIGPQPTNTDNCSFPDDGTQRVNVRATDAVGGKTTGFTDVTVNNLAPTIASVTNDGPVDEGSSATITVSASDPGTNDTLTYEFDCDNDGTYEVSQSSSSTDCTFDDEGSYTVNVRVSDGDGGTDTDSTTVTVNNVAPAIASVTNDGPADEGSAVTITVSASDPGNDTLTYEFDCDNDGTYEVSQSSSSTDCTFTSAGAKTVNVRVTDGDGGSDDDSTEVTVNRLNAKPLAGNGTASMNEDAAPITINFADFASDEETADANLTYNITAPDPAQGTITSVPGEPTKRTFDSATDFNGTVEIFYTVTDRGDPDGCNTSDPDCTAPKTSDQGKVTVTVSPINDAPVLTAGSTLNYKENDPATAIDNTITVSDVDDTNLDSATVQITGNYQNGQDVLSFTNTPQITVGSFDTVNGKLTLTGSATKTQYETALRSVKYNNTSENPSAATRTITWIANDGGPDNPTSTTVTSTINVTPVNDAPIADNETFNGANRAIGNTSLVVNDPTDGAPDPSGPEKTITGDILDGDTDVDGPGPLIVQAGTINTNDGGSVTIQSDGDFTFHPSATNSCTDHSDFFDYTVTDQDPSDPKTATGRVNVEIQDCVWYVDSSAGAPPAGTGGRSDTPFNSLSGVNGAGGAGDADDTGQKIFLYDGEYLGGLPLENSQTLLSERHGLVVPDGGSGNVTLVQAGGANTTIKGGLTLTQNNTIQGIHLGDNTSGGALSGSSVGTATMNTQTSGAINNATGKAVDISSGTLDMAFTGVSSSGSSTDGIRLDNVAGTFNATGGSIQNAAGQDIDISGNNSGDNANIIYSGSITDDQGTLVSVANQSGGNKEFNGDITDGNDGDGSGISLTNNTGATIGFFGGLTLSTGSNTAFSATGGGTVSVIDPAGSAANTIATTTGTALNVANTTIGGSDLNFQSISANGATNGIVLNNTGTSGNLSVTGNGGTCTIATPTCTGGTVQNTTADGISLTSTNNPSFDHMQVKDTAGHGISGTTTSGLSLSNSLVRGAGDADNEAGLYFATTNGTNLTGNSSITNTVVHAPADVGAFIQNYGGTLNLTVSGSTFSGTQKNTPGVVTGDDLMRLVADRTNAGSATITASFTGNTFDRSESDGIAATAQSSTGSGGGTLNLTADTNTFTGDNGGSTCPNGCNDNAIQAHATQDGTMKFTIQNNTIQNQRNEAIVVASDNTADVQATIQNNTIGTATSGSGSLFAQGIFLAPDDNADLVARVHNNIIRSTFFQGIWAEANDGTGGTPTMDVTVTNNTTPTPADTGGTVLGSIEVWSTTAAITCAKVESNTAATGVSGGESIALLQADTATFKIEGLPAPTSNASSYVAGKNPASSPPINAIASGPGSTFTGGTCRTPAATPTP